MGQPWPPLFCAPRFSLQKTRGLESFGYQEKRKRERKKGACPCGGACGVCVGLVGPAQGLSPAIPQKEDTRSLPNACASVRELA